MSNECRYLVQTIFAGTLVVFALGMVAAGRDSGLYLPLATGIVGLYLPSPIGAQARAVPQVSAPAPPDGSSPKSPAS